MTTTAPRVGDTPTAAQQALAEAWAEGHRTGWEHCQDGNYGNDHWDDPTPNPYAAASRPSVTDNARAEAQSGYTVQQTADYYAWRVQRVSDRIRSADYQRSVIDITALDGVQAFLDRIARDDLDVFAAGRAETTTATVEDTARAIHRALAPRWMSVAQALGPDQDAYEAMLADIAKSLADAGLLATARTRPTREQVTAAIGDAANSMQVGFGVVSITAAVDAVLALYADQPTEAEAGARALEQAAEAVYTDSVPSLAPWLLTRAARIRAGGA